MPKKYSFVTKIAKFDGLIIELGGLVILLLLPVSFIYNLITAESGALIKTIVIHVVLLILGAIAYKYGKRYRQTGKFPDQR